MDENLEKITQKFWSLFTEKYNLTNFDPIKPLIEAAAIFSAELSISNKKRDEEYCSKFFEQMLGIPKQEALPAWGWYAPDNQNNNPQGYITDYRIFELKFNDNGQPPPGLNSSWKQFLQVAISQEVRHKLVFQGTCQRPLGILLRSNDQSLLNSLHGSFWQLSSQNNNIDIPKSSYIEIPMPDNIRTLCLWRGKNVLWLHAPNPGQNPIVCIEGINRGGFCQIMVDTWPFRSTEPVHQQLIQYLPYPQCAAETIEQYLDRAADVLRSSSWQTNGPQIRLETAAEISAALRGKFPQDIQDVYLTQNETGKNLFFAIHAHRSDSHQQDVDDLKAMLDRAIRLQPAAEQYLRKRMDLGIRIKVCPLPVWICRKQVGVPENPEIRHKYGQAVDLLVGFRPLDLPKKLDQYRHLVSAGADAPPLPYLLWPLDLAR